MKPPYDDSLIDVDWNGDSFAVALDTLRQSIHDFCRLDEKGAAAFERRMAATLGNRAKLVADRRRYPEIARERIERPVIITGLPRSGTTLMQSLLAADPGARGPQYWEGIAPSPPPERAHYHDDPRIEAARNQLAQGITNDPEMMKKHPFAAQAPEDCGRFFELEFMSQNYLAPYYIPSYAQWLLAQDFGPAYRTHRNVLQHLQWRCPPGDHWVLKSPKHLYTLDALMQTYPDAHIVWMHRDPAQNIVSGASFASTYRRNNMPGFDLARLGQEWAANQEVAINRAMLARSRAEAAGAGWRICDVHYNALMADPLGEVERIYDHLAMALPDASRTAIAGWLTENPQDRHGRHSYAAADYGLDATQLRKRFAPYIEHFGVEPDRS